MKRYQIFIQTIFAVISILALETSAQTAAKSAVIISDELHHIGDGAWGFTSDSAERMTDLKNSGVQTEGPSFRAEFVILEESVFDVTLTIEDLYGHDPGPPIEVRINLQPAGTIPDNGKNLTIPIPPELLKLKGSKNIIQILAPSLEKNDVDDLEFRGLRLSYRKTPESTHALPELRFVRFANGRFEPASSLRHGDEFHVEAHFKTSPSQPPGKVQLNWTDGEMREIEVTPTEDSKLFRSVRMRLEPPVQTGN